MPKKRGAGAYGEAEPAEPAAPTPEEDAADEGGSKSAEEKLLEQAIKRFDLAVEADRDNRDAALSDLKFYAGDQWDPADLETRKSGTVKRPTITSNRLPQFVRQTTGDLRTNKPAIKAQPTESGDVDRDDVMEAVIQHIEHQSVARLVYANTAELGTACGIAHMQVRIVDSVDGKGREALIEQVDDPLAVYWDPSGLRDSTKAKWCFVVEARPRDEFEDAYPDVKDDWADSATPVEDDDWITKDEVRVAVYWCVHEREVLTGERLPTMKEIDEGFMDPLEAIPFEVDSAEELPSTSIGEPVSTIRTEVRSWLLTSTHVLEGGEEGIPFPGRWIPVVPMIGDVVPIGRKWVRRGLVRDAKDLQRLYNWALSLIVEAMALAPRGKWLVTEAMIEGRESEWSAANSSSVPYLTYTPGPGGSKPEWVNPSPFPVGLIEALAMFDQNMKAITGIYDASLGAKSNETSGVAIEARERQGDTSTYLFVDNFLASLERLGQILVEVIPTVYTDERMIRIVGADGREKVMTINGVDPETGAPINPIEAGVYDVRVDAGPAFTSRRAEAAAGMQAMVQAFPQLAPLLIDLIAQSQDWPDADKVAERAQLLVQSMGLGPKQPSESDQLDLKQKAITVEKTAEETRRLKLDNDAEEEGFMAGVRELLRGLPQFGPAGSDRGGGAVVPNGADRSASTGT